MKALLIKLFDGFTVDCRFLDTEPFRSLSHFLVYIPYYEESGVRTNDYQKAFYAVLGTIGGWRPKTILHVYQYGQKAKSNIF